MNPIFGYRCQNGRIHAETGACQRELTDIAEDDVAGFYSWKSQSQFLMHQDHMSLEVGSHGTLLKSYSCPASALFFTENLCHAGPVWMRNTPRVAIFCICTPCDKLA